MRFNKAKYLASYPQFKLAPKLNLPEFAFGGRSNVGKSSLINSILNLKKLAQTSKTPGKTKMLNYFKIMDNKNSDKLLFVDLPGFGYAKVSLSMKKSWQKLVEDYVEGSTYLQGFLLLIDSRRGLRDEELQLVEYLIHIDRDICPVLTKSDKLNNQQRSKVVRDTTEQLRVFNSKPLFPILHSAKTGRGNDLLWRWMSERISDESE